MENHFNAFISYKHAPEDNRVADAVHRGLEHFHIPGKLRKKTGVKRINRIFRDKAELPITNDLSDNIADALANSDYLIVLCSTNTKESAWVPREIDCFLKNHSKRDIFTVLVNGEPQDVIPEILQYEERLVTDEQGVEQVMRIPMEPLSCDYRMSPGKAKKTELPRLVCGLIGCAYDELMNRRRQYRMKQVTAVFSIALAIVLGFAGYMFYSRQKIHENYLESLRNQSKYLANESSGLLEKEQRIPALQLALEALPKDDEDDRPVTAEAIRALTDATLAYEGNAGNNIHAAWDYSMPNPVSDFQVSPDGKILAVYDAGSVFGVWDTETHQRILYSEDGEESITGIRFADDSHLLVWGDKSIRCYDPATGEKRWEDTIEEGSYKNQFNFMTADSSFYIAVNNGEFIEYEVASGKRKSEVSLPENNGFEDFRMVECRLSPDQKKIAFRGIKEMKKHAYGVLDLTTKKAELSELLPETVKDIEWLDTDSFMVSLAKLDTTRSVGFESTEIVSSDQSTVKCIEAADLNVKWTAPFVSNGVNLNGGFLPLGTSSVAYYYGNVITVYDSAEGRELSSNNVNNSIIDVSDRDGDGVPICITENGGYAVPAPDVDADAVYYSRYFTDELRQVTVNNGVYARQNFGNEVIYYGVHVYDDSWKALDEKTTFAETPGDYCLEEDHLAVLEGQIPELYVYGLDAGAGCVKVELEGDSIYKYKLLGIHDKRVYVRFISANSYELISVDVTGENRRKETLFDVNIIERSPCTMVNGKLVYAYQNKDFKTVLTFADTKKEIEMPKDFGFIKHAPVYYEAEKTVLLQGEATYAVDEERAQAVRIEAPDGWAQATCFSGNTSGGSFAVSDGKKILLADKSGKVSRTILCPGVAPVGMSFFEDNLMVLYNDGGLYQYALETGEVVKKTDVFVYNNFDGEAVFDYDEENHLIYIQMDRLTDVIDSDSGVGIAHIDKSFGHDQSRDIFVTIAAESLEKKQIGYYKRYTVKELIEKAHTILSGTEMTEALKTRYGL